MKTVTLYRPVGPNELELIEKNDFKAFPPRLPEQPIFYPVTNESYAKDITKNWNMRDHGVGFVTRFQVNAEFLSKYEVHIVGSREHSEYWIPAKELEEFNKNIVGSIEVIYKCGGACE